MEQNIEDRQIPGITAKGLVWFFAGVIAVIISVMTFSFRIENKLDSSDNIAKAQYNLIISNIEQMKQKITDGDAERKTLQVQVQTLQLQMARFDEKLGEGKR